MPPTPFFPQPTAPRRTCAALLCAALLLSAPSSVRSDEDAEPVAIVLTDVTSDAGIAGLGGDRFSFEDYDGDGDPDLLVNGRTLLRNDTDSRGKPDAKIRFTNVSDESGMKKGPGGGACWADFDGDGRPDVVTHNGGLKLQVKPGVFENKAQAWGLPKGQKGTTVGVGDFDGDGRPDVLFGGGEDWNKGDAMMYPRFLYRNEGAPGWSFTDMRAQSGIHLRPIGDRGVFRGDELWSNAACGDLDGDGLPEVFVAQVYTLPYSYTLLYRNRGGFKFREISGDAGVRRYASYGGAFADIDGDGDVDLVCGGAPEPKGKKAVCVYRNDTKPGPWIAFRLTGAAPGTDALGAQVVVETDKGRMVRQVESCMGSHAQKNESVLRFGLRGRTFERAWVRWPKNLIQELGEVKPGRVHEVAPPKKLPGFPGKSLRKLPAIRVEVPETVYADEPAVFKATCRGRNAMRWRWSADTDGDGTFELESSNGRLEGRFEAPRGELRIRLSHARGMHLEKVVRFPVRERQTDEDD